MDSEISWKTARRNKQSFFPWQWVFFRYRGSSIQVTYFHPRRFELPFPFPEPSVFGRAFRATITGCILVKRRFTPYQIGPRRSLHRWDCTQTNSFRLYRRQGTQNWNLETLHYNTRNHNILNQAERSLRILATRILLHKTNFPTINQVIDRIKFYRRLYILSNYKHDILREKLLTYCFTSIYRAEYPSRGKISSTSRYRTSSGTLSLLFRSPSRGMKKRESSGDAEKSCYKTVK